MTDKYIQFRSQIIAALNAIGIASSRIYFRKDTVPGSDDYPAAMIILESDLSSNTSKHVCNSLDVQVSVCLIVDTQNDADPDITIITLREALRAQLENEVGNVITTTEYYDARADRSRKVRIAKIAVEYRL